MMKKLSQFNGYIKDHEDTIVYNVKTKASLRFQNISVDDVKQYILNDESFDYIKYGLITYNDEIMETRSNYNKIRLDESNIMVNLVITYDCNCACKYCFENLENIELKKDNRIDDVICYINKISKGKDLYINYFGGEPLLDYQKIVYIQRNLKGQKNVFSHITTNGTLIESIDVEQILSLGINNFQITIDGDECTHNERRPLKENKNLSWKRTIEGILALLKNPLTTMINIRINIDESNYKNVGHIFRALPEKLRNNNKINFYISPVFGNSIRSSSVTLKSRSNMIKELWGCIKAENLPIDITLPKFSPCTKDNLKGSFYIDLSGNIYSCGADIGIHCRAEGVFEQRNKNFYDRASKQHSTNCYSCTFFYECMGGCDYEKKTNHIHCQYHYFKELYDYYFLNIARR